MSRFSYFLSAAKYTFAEDGLRAVFEKSRNNLKEVLAEKTSKADSGNLFVDVLFINGCDYSVPHPIRYRVGHQVEQLLAAGLTCSVVNAWDLSEDQLRNARTFVIFRCPWTEEIESFILRAKKLNKLVLYDIDDLVFDTRYTESIPHIQAMSAEERSLYDDGVTRMGRTLKLCDGALTTTETLAEELKRYVPLVFVNRNTASDDMLMLSDDALYRRDTLPTMPRQKISANDKKKYQVALARGKKREGIVRIGYFSGSITHNADFDLVLPALVEVLNRCPNVHLSLVGEIDLPDELISYRDRISSVPFCDWKRLPCLIAGVDINIAPLVDTVFNRAKSEIKWIEASLVKVPTVASRVGSFATMIEDGKTGLLCSSTDEWIERLVRLASDPSERERIASDAYVYCRQHCSTIGTAHHLGKFVREHQTPNVAMVMPSMNTSGGVLVALKHAAILQDDGYDVFFLNSDDTLKWSEFENCEFPVLNRSVPAGKLDDCLLFGRIDSGVATLWDTLDFLRRYPNITRKLYIVQNFETDFYLPGNPLRWQANATYAANYKDVTYLTISPWCKEWLEKKYGIQSRFAPNGIDLSSFYSEERQFDREKVRILIEGDCHSEYKNVDEAFHIVEQLDPTRFEIWYMTYTGTKKSFYRIDKNLGAIPHDQIADIYRKCDILLKTSLLESFSYPPLEMMSTGGYVVAVPNGGNSEYLVHEKNCLLYEAGCYDQALMAIERICSDSLLRKRLYSEGLSTARDRDWDAIKESVLSLYR